MFPSHPSLTLASLARRYLEGSLVKAAKSGAWVVIEDIDKAPFEVVSALLPLLQQHIIPSPSATDTPTRAHANFRLFGTIATPPDISPPTSSTPRLRPHRNPNSPILDPNFKHVYITPLPDAELQLIATTRHPNVPVAVIATVLTVYNDLCSGSVDLNRVPTIRDFFKCVHRLAAHVAFDANASGNDETGYVTERVRLAVGRVIMDVFTGATPDEMVVWGVLRGVANQLQVSVDTLKDHLNRMEEVVVTDSSVTVGGVTLDKFVQDGAQDGLPAPPPSSFVTTSQSLSLLTTAACSVSLNSPLLLTGETGTGKTTIVQRLADLCGRTMVVQNLSLSTDSADLLGGYR